MVTESPIDDVEDNDFGIDEEPKSKPKVRAGSFAFLMVFLNGLIMTATAFFVLNSFVNGMINENLLSTSQTTHTQIEDSIKEIEQSISIIESVLEANNKNESFDIGAFSEKARGTLIAFDKVFWVYKSDNSWRIHKIKHNPDNDDAYTSSLNSPGKELVKYISSGAFLDEEDSLHVVSDMQGIKTFTTNEMGQHSAFGLIKPIRFNGEVGGYLVATTQLYNVINNIVSSKKYLSSLNISIKDGFNSKSLFRFSDNDLMDSGKRIYNPTAMTIDVGNRQLFIQAAYVISDREAFMLKVPYLLLFFGLILTAMGALYIRSTARQSLRLAKLNADMAQKNYDLNTQMKESTRLNKVVKKSERENKAILNSISDVIFEIDNLGTIKFLNNTWYAVTGYSISDCLESNLFSYFDAESRAVQKQMFDELVSGDRAKYSSHAKIKCEDESMRSVELGISMLRHDEKRNLRAVGFIKDVEDKRRTEFALSEVEKKYRTIVENIAGGIYQLSAHGKYLSANPAMAKILGYEDAAQMIASVHDVNELIYKDVRKRLRFLRDMESFGDLQNAEFQVYTKTGGVVWVHESARAVYDEYNEFMYYEGSVNDITDRKEAEDKLNAAKVESDLASRAKSEFLTNMSHELRTPLNAIIGFSEIIKNETFGPVGSKEYIEYSNDIYEGGRRLLNIINEILDVSRIEAGERVLNEGIVNLHNLVDNCIGLSATKIAEAEVTVSNSIPADLPNLIGEELGMKQMVMNLLSNAIKFTSKNGRVTISAELNNKGGIRLAITDTGIGMDEAEVEKALSPFGQVGNKLSKSKAGTGLGLTLVESLIRLHEGSLELLSQKGIGTTATLIFPARRVAKQDGSRAYDPLSIDKTDYEPKNLN